MIGRTLAHYRVIEKLGSGGMGDVYRAEDTKLGREVALKVLPLNVADDPDRHGRFDREARAVASLNHPNIVTIHSVEEDAGVQFLTMELIDGKPLSEVIPKGGLPLSQLFDLAIPLADAISSAHEKGIATVIMEPIKGGVLANPPAEALAVMNAAAHKRTPVDWANMWPENYVGDARKATAEAGKRLVEAQTETLAKAIAVVKQDNATPELVQKYFKRWEQGGPTPAFD